MKCAIVDERISEKCERGLLLRGFIPIKLPPSKRLPAPMASHPDMLLFKSETEIIASAEYCEEYPHVFSDIRELSPSIRLRFTDDVFGEKYPHDRIFNALAFENNIIYKSEFISDSIIEYAKRNALNTVEVNQGYPACTTLAFGKSAITADEGVARALLGCGIKVTLIENGDISLPPYEYGFIGGASGVYNKEIYFLGNLQSHRNYKEIEEAILSEGYTPISLSDEPLTDLGKIIFSD